MIRLALLLALIAGQVQALSCMRPDVSSTYKTVDASEDIYRVMRGSLSFDASLMPDSYVEQFNQLEPVPATFQGMTLATDGFTKPITTDLTLIPNCAGPWCGTASPSHDVIVFARYSTTGFQVEVDACPWFTFFNPTDEMVEALISCANDQVCERADGLP